MLKNSANLWSISRSWPEISSRLSAAVFVAMPMFATGMLWSPTLELSGVILVLTSAVLIAVTQFTTSRRDGRFVQTLFGLDALCSGAAAGLALVFGWSEFDGVVRIQIPQMLKWHGMLNAFGFVGLSLAAHGLNAVSATARQAGSPTACIGLHCSAIKEIGPSQSRRWR